MAIDTLDKYIGASKFRLTWMKTGTRTLVAAMPYTVFDIAGSPGAGTLAIGNTANGVVPTDATNGYPIIPGFSSSLGYLARVEFGSSVACCFDLYDRVFACGAYSYAAGTTSLSSQPGFSGRLPSAQYSGLQVWLEVVTAFATGTAWTVHITYTDQGGTTGVASPDLATMAAAALPLGRMYQLPLAAGDNGIQKIESVVVTNGGTAMTAGTFNLSILRPLWFGRVITANGGDVHDLLRTGFPQIYEDSALYVILYADGTAVGLPDMTFQVAVG
jgi:hypothetical protein